MSTSTLTESQQQTVERVERKLVSGDYFTLIVNSNRSGRLGRGPIASRDWARIMQVVATYASTGDRAAATAFRIFGRINLYLTPNEVVAQVAEALAEVARDGWHDVVGATGPGAGRPSQYDHPTDLRAAIMLALLMCEVQMNAGYTGRAPGIGWVLRHLIERENITVPTRLPRVYAALND